MNKRVCCLYPLLCVVFAIIFLGSFPFVMGWISQDGEWTEDPSLELTARTIPDDENAYFSLKALKIELTTEDREKIEAHLNGDLWDSSFVDAQLATHEESLNRFETAVQMAYFQDPDLAVPDQASIVNSIPDLNITDTIRLSNLKALALMKSGEETAAFEQVFLSLELGEKMQESYGTLIHYAVGQDIQKMGLETMLLISKEAKNRELIKSYATKLTNHLPNTSNLAQTYTVEYQIFQEIFGTAEEAPSELLARVSNGFSDEETAFTKILLAVGGPYYYHPNDTRTLYTLYFNESIEKIRNFNCANTGKATKEDDEMYTQHLSLKSFFTENAIGQALLDSIIPRPPSLEQFCQNETLINQIFELD